MALEQLLRFKDLKRCGVVNSWPQLRYMQKECGFSAGLLLGANSRAWPVSVIEQWLTNRPIEPSSQVMERAAKSKRVRGAAATAEASPHGGNVGVPADLFKSKPAAQGTTTTA
jgi:hypothetical protein